MSVLYGSRTPQPSRPNSRPQRQEPEPCLAELLDDPVLHILMARDGVDRATLEGVIADARRKLGFGVTGPFEMTLFAECHA